jgi:hypothetical protein
MPNRCLPFAAPKAVPRFGYRPLALFLQCEKLR